VPEPNPDLIRRAAGDRKEVHIRQRKDLKEIYFKENSPTNRVFSFSPPNRNLRPQDSAISFQNGAQTCSLISPLEPLVHPEVVLHLSLMI